MNIHRSFSISRARFLPVFIKEYKKFLVFMQGQFNKDADNRFQKSEADFVQWDIIQTEGEKFLQPITFQLYMKGREISSRSLNITTSFEVVDINAVEAANRICSELVTNVTTETKKAINNYISAGIEEGKSTYDISRELRSVVGLNSKQEAAVRNFRLFLQDKYPTDIIDLKVAKYAKSKLIERTQAISRTEVARAQNVGYVEGLRNSGILEVEFSANASACEEQCQPLNGNIYSIEEGSKIIPVHNHCTCAMLPVTR